RAAAPPPPYPPPDHRTGRATPRALRAAELEVVKLRELRAEIAVSIPRARSRRPAAARDGACRLTARTWRSVVLHDHADDVMTGQRQTRMLARAHAHLVHECEQPA